MAGAAEFPGGTTRMTLRHRHSQASGPLYPLANRACRPPLLRMSELAGGVHLVATRRWLAFEIVGAGANAKEKVQPR